MIAPRSALLAALLTVGVAEAADERSGPVSYVEGDRRGRWWDLDLQLGYGWRQDGSGTMGLLGVRGGITLISGQWFLTAGAVVQAPLPEPMGFGGQLEVLHLGSGLWLQPGAIVDLDGHLTVTGAVGWSVVGIEGRRLHAGSGPAMDAVLLRFRIPVGLVALAVWEGRREE